MLNEFKQEMKSFVQEQKKHTGTAVAVEVKPPPQLTVAIPQDISQENDMGPMAVFQKTPTPALTRICEAFGLVTPDG